MIALPGLRALCLAVAAVVSAATAMPSAAESRMRDWHIVASSGSQRLALRYLLDARLPGSAGTVDHLARQLAVMPGDGGPVLSFSVAPVLNYDRNINDGIPSDTIKIGGLSFEVSEDGRAKSGIVLGAQVSANARTQVLHGLAWDVSAKLKLEHAPRWSYDTVTGTGATCLLYTSDRWLSLDICAMHIRKKAGKAEESRTFRSVTLGKVFTFRDTLAETALTIQSQTLRGQTQLSVTGSGTWFRPDGNLYSVSLGAGQEKPGVSFPTLTARLGLATDLWGKPVNFGIGYVEERGARFFGSDKDDRTVSLSVRRAVTERMTAEIIALRRTSSVAEYSETSLEMNFTFPGLTLR